MSALLCKKTVGWVGSSTLLASLVLARPLHTNAATTTTLTAPTVYATPLSARVKLRWNRVSGASSYAVFRATRNGAFRSIETGLTSTNLTDTGLVNGTLYQYKVRGVSSTATGALSDAVAATPLAVPTTPSGLRAVAGNAQVLLSWSSVSVATSYALQRSTSYSGTYTTIAASLTSPSYTDSAVSNGTAYYYRVSAKNSSGSSSNSKPESATPTAASTATPTPTSEPTATPTTAPTATPTSEPTATPTTAPTATPTSATTIVDLANAYIATLSTTQQAATVLSSSATNAAKWSNLPATPSDSGGTNNLRNGVSYSTLSTEQKTAWLNLVQAALGADSSNDYNQFSQIRASDDYLGSLRNGYSGDYEYVAFVGTPSTSGSWLLQVGGHHNAHNYYYTGTTLQTSTPYFLGVEPQSFTYSGTSYTPLSAQRNGMYNLINSLSSSQLSSAKLSSSFSDVYLGPGSDARSKFPTGTSGRGILASNLTSAQQSLLKIAIAAWTQNSPLASTYQSLYEAELSSTYVAYSGTTTFNNQGDYVRIDGPHVWIEFVCQSGVVVSNQIHFHTIWRDRVTDYNAAYGFSTASFQTANFQPSPKAAKPGFLDSAFASVRSAAMTLADGVSNAAQWVFGLMHSEVA